MPESLDLCISRPPLWITRHDGPSHSCNREGKVHRQVRWGSLAEACSMAQNAWILLELANPQAVRQHDGDHLPGPAVDASQREIGDNPRPRLIQVPPAVSGNEFHTVRRRTIEQADIRKRPAIVPGGTSDPVACSVDASHVRPHSGREADQHQPVPPHGMTLPGS